MKLHPRLLLAPLVLAAAGAWAGTVSVSFVDPARYTDAGTSQWDEKDNLLQLARHLEVLGQRALPANQSLQVEVLDVDLAGTAQPSRRDGSLIRVARGRADWPRIHLRYTLQAPGQAPRSGDEWVQDLNYGRGTLSVHRNEPLFHEKRMLDSWFHQRFGPDAVAAR